MATIEELRQDMIKAEENGMAGKGAYGSHLERCTYWYVGDHIIIHLTDDVDFNACMLTEEMMDNLIIVRKVE